MDGLKDIRWKQRFENFNKLYTLLKSILEKKIIRTRTSWYNTIEMTLSWLGRF